MLTDASSKDGESAKMNCVSEVANVPVDEPAVKKVCGDPGRQMFFAAVGQPFSAEPKLKPMKPGTRCGLCGCSDVQLWDSGKGKGQCLSQLTITRKRAGRDTAAEPVEPPPKGKEDGMKCFGDGNVIVAGPHVAIAVTKVLPSSPLPDSVDVRFPQGGEGPSVIFDLVVNPPRVPFAVFALGQSADFQSEVTVDASRIIVNGPEPYEIDVGLVRDVANTLSGLGIKDIIALMDLRDRLANGGISATDASTVKAMTAILAAAGKNMPFSTIVRSLPPKSSPAGRAVMRMVKHFAAHEPSGRGQEDARDEPCAI